MAADQFTRNLFDWLQRVGFDHRVEPLSAKLAIVLGNHMNRQTGDAWPSQALLARSLKVSERTVRRALADLVTNGHLDVRHDGIRNVNRYKMAGEGRPDRVHLSGATGQICPVDGEADRPDLSGRPQDSDRPDLSGATGQICPTNYLREPSEEESSQEDNHQLEATTPAAGVQLIAIGGGR